TLIHSAWKQLQSYPDQLPKILVLVNDETGADVGDLEEAFQGFLDYGNEETGYVRNVVSARLANGRIRDEKAKIDLYVWFDRHYGTRSICLVLPAGEQPRTEVRDEGPFFRMATTR